jgi:uncharacterized protein involved in response to NO
MLRAPRSAHLAFIAVASAGALRVLAPALPAAFYLPALDSAGLAWSSAFILFLVGYCRVLVTARVDGR